MRDFLQYMLWWTDRRGALMVNGVIMLALTCLLLLTPSWTSAEAYGYAVVLFIQALIFLASYGVSILVVGETPFGRSFAFVAFFSLSVILWIVSLPFHLILSWLLPTLLLCSWVIGGLIERRNWKRRLEVGLRQALLATMMDEDIG